MAPLHYAAKFDPFLSLYLRPHALHPGAIQGKEGIKFCHLATSLQGRLLDGGAEQPLGGDHGQATAQGHARHLSEATSDTQRERIEEGRGRRRWRILRLFLQSNQRLPNPNEPISMPIGTSNSATDVFPCIKYMMIHSCNTHCSDDLY